MRTTNRPSRFPATLAATSLALAASFVATRADAQATVSIDITADVHAISPLIYGMNFTDSARQSAARVPFTRWGGNSTTRYNYQTDVHNTGADYYFENLPGCWNSADSYCATPPASPMDSSTANAFLQGAHDARMTALFTIPTIGWVPSAPPVYNHPFPCGCPSVGYDHDPYDTRCGNALSAPGGSYLACPAPTTTSTAVGTDWARGWVSYLVGRFGPSNGERIYALDNEPALWSSTHHDVHPARLTYDELWQRMRDHATVILDADPTAQISGPAEWGWPNYFCSDADDVSRGCFATSSDRAAHGGEELVAWLLDQAHAYEMTNGRRILHYLDLHYYPQGGNPPDITRSLWDPSYRDPSWIDDTIRLIPRMREWVAAHYPGTKLMVSEYDFYHHDEAVGAVTYAEVLGIFGREGLDAATAWSPPDVGERAFAAYRLYRNFDGAGGSFEATSVRATVSGSTTVRAYAAVGPTRLTVALVNEAGASATTTVDVGAFGAGAMANVYASSGTGDAIVRGAAVPVTGGRVTVSLAATSIAMLVVDGVGPMMPDAGVDSGASDAAIDVATNDVAATDGAMDGFVPPADAIVRTDATHGNDSDNDASDERPGTVTTGCHCRAGGPRSGHSRSNTGWWALGVAIAFATRTRRSRRR